MVKGLVPEGVFDGGPEPQDELSGAPLEALREELNHLNKGLDELLRRRRAVTTAINVKLDDSRMHLMSSDEFFAKVTGRYEGDSEMAEGPVPAHNFHETPRRF